MSEIGNPAPNPTFVYVGGVPYLPLPQRMRGGVVNFNSDITSLTATDYTGLKGVPTAPGLVSPLDCLQIIIGGEMKQYQFQPYVGGDQLPGIVTPADYNATTNPYAWVEVA
jgi:hypothetical protein